MVILDTSYAEVSVDREKSLGKVIWKSKCTHEEYVKAFETILDVQDEYHIIRYVSDLRNQGIVSAEDRKWFEKEALPRAIKHGLVAAAVIVDGNVFKTHFVNFIKNSAKRKHLPIKAFNNYQDAEDWLMSKL